jgi:hypothetical protein
MRAYQAAIEAAKQELKTVRSSMSVLAAREKHLEAFIADGELLAPKRTRSEAHSEAPLRTRAQAPATQLPLVSAGNGNGHQAEVWQNVVEAINKTGHPMTARQIVEALQRMGTPIRGKFQTENVRAIVSRKSDVFERVGEGLVALRSWPANQKTIRQAPIQ